MADNQFPNDAKRGIEPFSPFVSEERRQGTGKPLSLRGYSLALTSLLFAGFFVMGACASLFGNVDFLLLVIQHYGAFSILSFVGSIAGIFMMSSAKRSQSVGLSLAGFGVFALTFGFMTSIVLLQYPVATISTAFMATAGITVVFACLGVAFPQVFTKVRGVLGACLLGLIVVELVMMLLRVDQGIVDFAVIAVFCGFIGYDFHKAMYDEPTLVNAVYNASELFLDVLNVFVRILSILGRRD